MILKFFEPMAGDCTINFTLLNLKRAFTKLGISIENSLLAQVLAKYDSNFDNELTYSDITDMFKPKNAAL